MSNVRKSDDGESDDEKLEDSPVLLGGTSRSRPRHQDSFDKLYSYSEPPQIGFKERIRQKGRDFSPSLVLVRLFPILGWLKTYSVKQDLPNDIVSGLTVGVMHLPQGLAYAMLAGVPPITGLYMAFFPVLIYTLMGTSHHVSMGTLSIVCIMTSNAVLKFSNVPLDSTMNNHTFIADDNNDTFVVDSLTPVQVATAVCFTVGVAQLLMGICKLGVLSVLLSDTLMSGFSTAAAVHVLASQLKNLTGIKVANYNGIFKVVFILQDLVTNIETVNYIALSISGIAMTILYFYSELIKPRLEKLCHYPFPIELVAIVAGTLTSNALQLSENYGIKTVGNIPVGLPSANVPPFWLVPSILSDGMIIAIVAFSINLSMASILAKRGNYSINANQELLASGTGNIFASFFACVPFAASLSRSLIQQNVGGKTQIASLVSCLLLLLVLLVIGPFFEPLPNCVLASIVIVALKKMFEQFKDLPSAWTKSRLDGTVWLVTFLSSVLLDIDYGLGVGIVTSILSVLYFSQRLNVLRLGNVPNTDLYLDIQRYKAAKEVSGVCIIQIAGGLHFANRDYILHNIYKLFGLSTNNIEDCDDCENENHFENNKIKCIVLDMQGVCFIDPSASEAISTMYKDLKNKFGILLFFANCSGKVLTSLHRYKFFTADYTAESHAYPSVHDAVYHANLII